MAHDKDNQKNSSSGAAGSNSAHTKTAHPGGGHGQGSHHAADRRVVSCAVLTISDTRTPATDKSGDTLVGLLEAAGHRLVMRAIVPDDMLAIRHAVLDAAESEQVEALILTGGTGVSPRDVTIQAIEPLFRKRLPGFGEMFRYLSFDEIGPMALLSQATAGVVARCVVFALPGSTGACTTAMERLILPIVGHATGLLRAPRSA